MESQDPNIWLYYPNLIVFLLGYGRVLLSFVFFWYAFDRPVVAVVCYALSTRQILDFFDGKAARYFNQCSKMGEILDMITDRYCIASMLAVLCHLYNDYGYFWLFCLSMDVGSHWFQQYAALLCGEHHKKAKSKLILVRWYYEKYWFFALHCIGAEVYKNYLNLIYFLKVFVVVSYIVYYVEAFYCFHALKRELQLFQYALLLIFINKVIIVNSFQLVSAMQKIIDWDIARKKKIKGK